MQLIPPRPVVISCSIWIVLQQYLIMACFKISSLIILSLGFLVLVKAGEHETDPVIQEWLTEMQNKGQEEVSSGGNIMAPLVTTINGTIKGGFALTVGGKIIYEYLGIPYAKPPVGPLRFQAPQPYEGWGDDIYNATKQPNACAQYLANLTKADEDCLYLSVYSRREGGGVGTGPLLPVVFFIHGGGYAFGQNSYYTGIKLLNNQDIVLVTVQYRLGPLGFLSTGDDTVSSNNGMKDMVQGLRWVKENIQAFGGDPNQVTVMGESAGSASALYMLISPLAQGLYNKVVAMSGSPLQEWAIDRNPERSARRMGALLNCSMDTNAELVECLKEKDWMPMVRAGLAVIMEDFQNFEIRLHGCTPVIEGNVPGAFLPDDPLKLLKEGAIPDVPVLLGTVQHEGILPLAGAHFLVLNPEGKLNDSDYMRDEFPTKILSTWGVDESQNGASVSKALASGYLKEGTNRTDFIDMQYQLLDMLSVLFMKAPVLKTAEILSKRLSSVYLYNFEHYNGLDSSLYNLVFNLVQNIIGGEKPPMKSGICHADDLIYMFRLPFVLGPADTIFSRAYVKLFTNFFVHGDPTPEATSDYAKWPKFNVTDQYYMTIDRLPFEVKQDYTRNWRLGMKGEE